MRYLDFLEAKIPLPIRFNTMLPFGQDEIRSMPWLTNETRYYNIENELGKGGRAIAYKGFVCNAQGERIDKLSQSIVLKIPNLNTQDYTTEQIKEYLIRQADDGGREWRLTRSRLHGCKYANPIFDFTIYQVPSHDYLLLLPITCQLFLTDAISLDDYLLKTGQRAEPYLSTQGIPHDNWHGLSDHNKWLELAKSLAIGLADIHQRRVVHGDIWPPNIFIKIDENGNTIPIFIDFGESFPIEPRGIPRTQQRDHAYRAPERKDAESIVTQLADVYSFGKLLLHLAIGEEPILSSSFTGHLRREKIREKFEKRNHQLIIDNPHILDIICKCVSLDPVDRPTMNDVVRALDSYVNFKSRLKPRPSVQSRISSIDQAWKTVIKKTDRKIQSVGPYLEELVEQRLYDIEQMIMGLSNDVVNLIDVRERLILDLLILFQRLESGDRFISLTHPRMWQGTALGLDGRYFTATQSAVFRGASVQRVFLFSIQEVGHIWAKEWADKLEKLGTKNNLPNATRLANLIRQEIATFLAASDQVEVSFLTTDILESSRERLRLVLKSYVIANKTICKNLFDTNESFQYSNVCKGMYLGLSPVSTIKRMNELKASHPFSVFYYSKASEQDKYLLMMTDSLGRNFYGKQNNEVIEEFAFLRTKPELRGITVFKSVFGIPEDRIKRLEQVFRQSVNIGGWINEIHQTITDKS
jgi:serine/threonine protein kinase